MRFVVAIGHVDVFTVNAQCVLRQVVGSNRKEIRDSGQTVGDDSGGGGLYHNADRNVLDFYSFVQKLVAYLLCDGAGQLNLLLACNQREHNL